MPQASPQSESHHHAVAVQNTSTSLSLAALLIALPFVSQATVLVGASGAPHSAGGGAGRDCAPGRRAHAAGVVAAKRCCHDGHPARPFLTDYKLGGLLYRPPWSCRRRSAWRPQRRGCARRGGCSCGRPATSPACCRARRRSRPRLWATWHVSCRSGDALTEKCPRCRDASGGLQ